MSPILAIFLAYLMAAVTTTLYAWLGAYAIDKAAGRHTMIAVAAAILLAAIVHQLVATVPLLLLLGGYSVSPGGETPDFLSLLIDWSFVGHVLGWIVGLWASGFPGLVKTSSSVRSGPAPVPGR